MKIRQFFKNFFQKIVDKHRETLSLPSSPPIEYPQFYVRRKENDQQAANRHRHEKGKNAASHKRFNSKNFQVTDLLVEADALSPNPFFLKNQIDKNVSLRHNPTTFEPRLSQMPSIKQQNNSFFAVHRAKDLTHNAKKGQSFGSAFTGKLTLRTAQKAHFVRQLSVLLNAGMDLCSALETLEDQEYRNRRLQTFIHYLLLKIETGEALSNALASGNTSFETSEIAMVRAGEATGQQAETLDKLARLIEKKLLIKKKIISAFFYPVTVLAVSSVVVLLLTTFVIPKFEKIIADQVGSDAMPALTAMIIQVSRFISEHLFTLVIALSLFLLSTIGIRKLVLFQKLFYGIFLKIPIFGNCITKWNVVLFARTFGDLLLCGCSLVESLKMAQASLGNFFMREHLSKTVQDVQQGMSLTESLHRQSVLPPMAKGLIKVGEESGKLGEMMNRIATTYETQLDETITRITALLEPILVIFLAIFVGTVVVGLFLPLVSLIQNIGE